MLKLFLYLQSKISFEMHEDSCSSPPFFNCNVTTLNLCNLQWRDILSMETPGCPGEGDQRLHQWPILAPGLLFTENLSITSRITSISAPTQLWELLSQCEEGHLVCATFVVTQTEPALNVCFHLLPTKNRIDSLAPQWTTVYEVCISTVTHKLNSAFGNEIWSEMLGAEDFQELLAALPFPS